MVQILCTDISQISKDDYQILRRKASPERRQRADNYRSFVDAVRCIAAEALLRMALKNTFGHWEGFSVSRTGHGKPFLEGQEHFHFSISHSGKWVVLACGESEVGIDVQEIIGEKAKPAFARRFFTAEEQQYLTEQPDYSLAFHQIWTGKESYLKYLGTGLSKALNSFSVLSPDEGLQFYWETLEQCSLCLCARETEYNLRMVTLDEL